MASYFDSTTRAERLEDGRRGAMERLEAVENAFGFDSIEYRLQVEEVLRYSPR